MRVLRAELGIGPAEVKSVLSEALEGAHSVTMPEMKCLARRLRASGVDAVAARPWGR